jgi:hypothetical protein
VWSTGIRHSNKFQIYFLSAAGYYNNAWGGGWGNDGWAAGAAGHHRVNPQQPSMNAHWLGGGGSTQDSWGHAQRNSNAYNAWGQNGSGGNNSSSNGNSRPTNSASNRGKLKGSLSSSAAATPNTTSSTTPAAATAAAAAMQ